MPEDNKWVKEFTKCPSCGSEQRMFEQMGQEMKERGLSKEDIKFCYEMKSGALSSQQIMAKIPIGGDLPAYALATDICLGCGLIYAVRLERTNATKTLVPPTIALPNRAQRRVGMQGGQRFQLPPINNSSLS